MACWALDLGYQASPVYKVKWDFMFSIITEQAVKSLKWMGCRTVRIMACDKWLFRGKEPRIPWCWGSVKH